MLKFELLFWLFSAFIELIENIDEPFKPLRSIPIFWTSLKSLETLLAKSFISDWTFDVTSWKSFNPAKDPEEIPLSNVDFPSLLILKTILLSWIEWLRTEKLVSSNKIFPLLESPAVILTSPLFP